MAIKGMGLGKAVKFLKDVIVKKQCVPFRRHTGDIGRCAQAKAHGVTQGRWPQKSCKVLRSMLENAASNAEVKALQKEALYISHIQVNRARKQRRRTYRAHGRINPYMCSPCHVELVLTEAEEPVARPADISGAIMKRKKVSQKKLARERMKPRN